MKTLLTAMLILISGSSFAAGSFVEAEIEFVQIGSGWTSSGVYVVVKMNKVQTGKPACATDDRYAIDPSTEHGKALYSALLSAKHSNSTIEVKGIGDCNIMGKAYESIDLIRVK